MAMIENIRKRRELLLILIGLGMLGFLIPYDAVMALFGRGGPGSVYVGSIDGSKVSLAEFQDALRKRKQILKYGSEDQLADAVWDDLVEARILGDQYAKIGLFIGKEEYDEIRFGMRTSSFVNSTFFGGAPDAQKRKQLEETFVAWYNSPNVSDRQNWEYYREVIVQNRLREKYDILIRKGVYANSLEGKAEYLMKEDKIDFDFVVKRFVTIPDSLVSVKESDIKAYYEKNKKLDKYKQTASRDIEYLAFPVSPSADDTLALVEQLLKLKEDFAAAESDSLFVLANSGMPFFAPRKYRTGDAAKVDTKLEGANPGDVVGPFHEGESMKLARVRKIEKLPEVKARHILINIENDDEKKARAKADSLKNVIKKGEKFEDLARAHSKDPGSGAQGGDLGWFGKGAMVKEFEDACFNGKVGDLPIVKSQFGFHLIEILERREYEQYTLAEISNKIEASPATLKSGYALANDFAMNNGTEDKLRLAAEEFGGLKPVNVLPRQNQIPGISDSGRLISWVYGQKTEAGMVSSPIQAGNQYIIAVVTKITKSGVPTYDNIRDIMESEVYKEKKAEYYIKLLKDANTLEETAELAGERINQARGISLSSTSLPQGGNESYVIGKAFSLADGEMTMPIKGDNGVYVLAFYGIRNLAPEKASYDEEKETLARRHQGRTIGSVNGIYASLKKRANVKDERSSW